MGFLTGRVLMWVILGGGALAVLIGFYSGAIQKGASAEFARWQTVVFDRTQEVRKVNDSLDKETADWDRQLQIEEQRIYERWAHPEVSQ